MLMEAFEAQKLARVDALTRRAFREEAANALDLAARHRHPVSAIAFDLGHFKAINDMHGDAAGDAVLIAAVEAAPAPPRRRSAPRSRSARPATSR